MSTKDSLKRALKEPVSWSLFWGGLICSDLRGLKLMVPRIFYVNQRQPKEGNEGASKYRPLIMGSLIGSDLHGLKTNGAQDILCQPKTA